MRLSTFRSKSPIFQQLKKSSWPRFDTATVVVVLYCCLLLWASCSVCRPEFRLECFFLFLAQQLYTRTPLTTTATRTHKHTQNTAVFILFSFSIYFLQFFNENSSLYCNLCVSSEVSRCRKRQFRFWCFYFLLICLNYYFLFRGDLCQAAASRGLFSQKKKLLIFIFDASRTIRSGSESESETSEVHKYSRRLYSTENLLTTAVARNF